MTAMDIATAELVSDDVTRPASQVARRAARWPSTRGVPATRDLEPTLWAVLALAGAAIGVGALVRPGTAATVAFAFAGAALVVAVAILRTLTTLSPPALQADRRRGGPIRVAVVGTPASALDLGAALHASSVPGVEIVGAISPTGGGDGESLLLGSLDDARATVELHDLDVVLVGPGVSRQRVVDIVMRTCEGHRVRVYDMARFYEDLFGHVPIGDVDSSSWFEHVLHPRFRERRSQRVLDVLVAGALALVFLPILGVAALLIRRDGGPALFRQVRVGRDGRTFVMLKLRTMHLRESSSGWTAENDPRVTTIGRLLRRLHLDELPQLLNVLRGDMTLVGPRPEQPDIVEHLEQMLPLWRGRHRYKPGLTGWAQVRCGYAGSHDGSARKLAHDLYYLRHQSLALDAAILAQTAASLLFAHRSEGNAVTPFVVPPAEEVAVWRGIADRQRSRTARIVGTRPGAPRALVTGGAGFIGSHLVDRLLEDGYDVVAVDDLSAGRSANLAQALTAGARLEAVDVTSAHEIRRVFMTHRPEVVFHLAAQIEVIRAVEDPLVDATANVVGTLAVLEAARACGAARFVLASSGGAIYGDAVVMPTPEQAALVPLSPYGAAKLAAEQYTSLYSDLYGLSTATLRLANVYGPRQGMSGEGGVIARFCRAKADGVRAKVFGDGLQTRDYVHVRDVVAAFAAAGRSDVTGALNIGTGTETTLLDLLEVLSLPADFADPRSGEVRRSVLDATAALRRLEWRALTSLADGLEETLAFTRAVRAQSQIAA